MSGPELNPREDEPIDREEYERAMGQPACIVCRKSIGDASYETKDGPACSIDCLRAYARRGARE